MLCVLCACHVMCVNVLLELGMKNRERRMGNNEPSVGCFYQPLSWLKKIGRSSDQAAYFLIPIVVAVSFTLNNLRPLVQAQYTLRV